MAWTAPHTWYVNETMTSGILNAHLRDNMNVLKTTLDDDGTIRPALRSFGFNIGAGNPVGAADTQMTAYDVNIPAGFLSVPGEALIMDITTYSSATAGTKYMKCKLGTGTLVTLLTATAVSSVYQSRFTFRYRTGTVISVQGETIIGTHLALTSAMYAFAAITPSANMDSNDQVLSIWLAGASANEIMIADYTLYCQRSITGATI